MPPLRTFLPVAPVKTERTHEENQERAYIAASRRGDRSLEARVESARRASEIHKRRTGRSLRVTEQDVLNEEMYEEEDDDLPSQYRRLTAHLQTGSADFNRRLAAYLTNHVAMRSALDQAITASYAQQFPNAPQFAHNQPGMFPSPFFAQSSASPPHPLTPASTHPVTPHSPHTITSHSPHPYRTAPYPMPGMRGYRPHGHQRSASISNEQEFYRQQIESAKDAAPPEPSGARRASMPAPKPDVEELNAMSDERAREKRVKEVPPSETNVDASDDLKNMPLPPSFSPFTTSLPPDTQQLVGLALDPMDPFTSSLMAGGEGVCLPQYDNSFYNYTPKDLDPNFFPGMDPVRAPPASSHEEASFYQGQSTQVTTTTTSNLPQLEDLKGGTFLSLDGDAGSAEGAWDAFIDDSTWAENAS